jgi:hypothetical protein
MTKDEFASSARGAKRRILRRVYVAVAVLIVLMLPLIILGATDSIRPQVFQISLAVYSLISVPVMICVLRRYANREFRCPNCEHPLWREPDVFKVFTSGRCTCCDHVVISDDQVA